MDVPIDLLRAMAGGLLIGLAAGLLLVSHGKIAGVSGLVSRAVREPKQVWPIGFVAGLMGAGTVAALWFPSSIGSVPRSLPTIAAAGLLVGFGTRLGNGCTSGHGVCGLSRLSPRSLAATLSFIAAGMAAVAAFSYVVGGAQ